MKYDAVVVGGGIAGLTAAAYIAKSGKSVVLFERQPKVGGLVQTFQRNNVYFDSGLRSIENSGIVFPMLRQLGIDIEFQKVTISVGIEDKVIKVIDKNSIAEYEAFLKSFYPDSASDISAIIKEIKKIMGYMDVLYGIDNPALMDFAKNKKYLFGELLPWLFRFLFTMRKINKLYEPVEDYLARLTNNQALIDIIAQHFFKNTPISFALSYFSLYLDYHYPKGGTGIVGDRVANFVTERGGVINTGISVTNINPEEKYIMDSKGNRIEYSNLIWASDLKQLYNVIPIEKLENKELIKRIDQKRAELNPLKGGDSVFTVYLTVNERKEYFENICTGHFFYTPDKRGLSSVSKKDIDEFISSKKIQTDNIELKNKVKDYLQEYFRFNTFEIAIPVLRDPTLAPEGKVGLEVSLFLDYKLDKRIEEFGWKDEIRDFMEILTIEILNDTIYPGIKDKVANRFSSSPSTFERLTGNSHGALTGWAFTNPFVPAVNQMLKVNNSVKTILPNVFQAGQWTYSPSGFPMSIVTGKLAADRVIKSKSK
ncbi:phytoene desaturase family protein [Perlabentimonas gracilis]|uniref:phytoene desaturase family protein n=1 Tax=Perlabentimonas gracilis TaxID=2715279 RepID=UPI00140B16CC|nr:NAD(P)/FAD-dependent oxidoreductase [Perlabentimonas gracilis]NHB67758.1 NAD(P)/FAD-dependent oxidoreductase [Perlabentimonas gracilis]